MKNIAYLLLFFLLTSANTTVQASTLAGGSGWRVASTVADGIGVTVNGAKDIIVNGAKKTVTGVANVTPTASQVGKFMGKNLGTAAVIGAMDLLLDGVDYVLDPANNSVNYKPKNQDGPWWFKADSEGKHYEFGSLNALCSSVFANTPKLINGGPYKWISYSINQSATVGGFSYCYFKSDYSGYSKTIIVHSEVNPTYDPANSQPKSIPLVNLGSQVINQAQEEIRTGNPAIAVPVTQAAATAVVGEAATDDAQARPIVQQLEQNPTYPSVEEGEGTITQPEVIDPATGEVVKPAEQSSIKFTFPKACEWFPQACEFIDWVRTDPEVESEIELPEKEIERHQIDDDLIKASGRSCPADITFDVDGLPFGITAPDSFKMQPVCDVLEPLKYVFVFMTTCLCAFLLVRF